MTNEHLFYEQDLHEEEQLFYHKKEIKKKSGANPVFYENSIEFEKDLVSSDSEFIEIQKVISKDISDSGFFSKSKEFQKKNYILILKLVILNLYESYRKRAPLRYSRENHNYIQQYICEENNSFVSGKRLKTVFDWLEKLEYIEQHIGFHETDSYDGRITRIVVLPKLKVLFLTLKSCSVKVAKQHDLIILKDSVEYRKKSKKNKKKFQIKSKQIPTSYKIENYPDVQTMKKYLEEINGVLSKCELKIIIPKKEIMCKEFVDSIDNCKRNNSLKFIEITDMSDLLYQYPNGSTSNSNIEISETMQPSLFNCNEIEIDYTNIKSNIEWYNVPSFHSLTKNGGSFLFLLNRKILYRVFNNNNFRCGGRFYGGVWQFLPSELRKFIFINGNPTKELDYCEMHLRLLYHRSNLDCPENPYNIECNIPGIDRSVFKKVSLIVINAYDEKSAHGAVNNFLEKEKKISNYGLAVYLVKKFKEVHAPITNRFHSGAGIVLQYLESMIAEKIMLRLLRQGIIALPIHDSFLCEEQHRDKLKLAMIEEYEKIVGFEPKIKESDEEVRVLGSN